MTRRSFLSACIKGAVAMLGPACVLASAPLPRLEPEEVFVDWVRGVRLHEERYGYAEIRFREAGGELITKMFRLTKEQPVAWLTKETGWSFASLFREGPVKS
jgi:hypothetical protein